MWQRLTLSLRAHPLRVLIILAILLMCVTTLGVWRLWLAKKTPTCSDEFDLAIIAAEIIDGLGGPSYTADVGVRNGHIVCIGKVDLARVRQSIDGKGLTVAPGFIDVHTHVEQNVPTVSAPFLAPNFVRQGVTTIITGNCGRSFLDLGKLFALLKTNGSQVNVASLVGHNTIRRQVMKESAADPTPAQLQQMNAFVRAAMRDGSIGLSTGLEYTPGTFAKTDEIVSLSRTVAETGGLYVSHIRDEGPKGEAAIREAISIGETAGLQVHISHFKAQGPNQWGSANQRLRLVQSALARGLKVSMDQYPYTASSTGLAILVPSWLSEGGLSEARKKLADPPTRKRIREEMLDQLRRSGWKDYSFARVASCGSDRSLVGLTIPEIARKRSEGHIALSKGALQKISFTMAKTEQGATESDLDRQADTVIDLFSHGGAQMVFFEMNEDDVETIMKTPQVMFGSDSNVREESAAVLPHPRGLGTFPRVLGLYARDKKLFSIEEGVRRMTSLPAATFGLNDRGQIKEGYWADLVIFDRSAILDTATYDQPLSTPQGIYYVIVNGALVLEKGRLTKSLPGKAIRFQQPAANR